MNTEYSKYIVELLKLFITLLVKNDETISCRDEGFRIIYNFSYRWCSIFAPMILHFKLNFENLYGQRMESFYDKELYLRSRTLTVY